MPSVFFQEINKRTNEGDQQLIPFSVRKIVFVSELGSTLIYLQSDKAPYFITWSHDLSGINQLLFFQLSNDALTRYLYTCLDTRTVTKWALWKTLIISCTLSARADKVTDTAIHYSVDDLICKSNLVLTKRCLWSCLYPRDSIKKGLNGDKFYL